jgi:hypothetical protein
VEVQDRGSSGPGGVNEHQDLVEVQDQVIIWVSGVNGTSDSVEHQEAEWKRRIKGARNIRIKWKWIK